MTLLLLAGAGLLGYLFLKKDQHPQGQQPGQQFVLPPRSAPPQAPPPPSVPINPPFGTAGSPVLYTSSIPTNIMPTGGNLGTSYNVRTDINVRSDPSTSTTNRIGGFSGGTTVISLGEAQGEWIKVTGLNSDTGMPVSGWVMKSYLEEQTPSIPSGSTWMGEI